MKNNDNYTPIKKNLSSTQVLKTLQTLMEDNYTMAELIQKLNENEQEYFFNNSIISKYINTCRYCGIQIPKIHNRYYVSSIPFGMNISEKEHTLIKDLQDFAKASLSLNANKKLTNFLIKLSKYSNKEIKNIDKNTINITLELFQKSIKSKNRIKLMFKNKTILECTPVNIVQQDEKTYLIISDGSKEKRVLLDRIAGFEIIKKSCGSYAPDGGVVYKLTGNLAKNYTLRENESIVTNGLPEYETITNKNEDLQDLISRLLRYGDLCEIMKPEYCRTNIKNLINETLANYGE